MLRNIYLNNLFLCQFFYCVFSPMNWNPALRVLPGRALPAWAPLQPRRPLRVEAVPAMHVGHHPVDRGTHSRSTHFFNLKNMTFEKTSWIWNMTVLFYVLCTLRKFCQFTVRAMKKVFVQFRYLCGKWRPLIVSFFKKVALHLQKILIYLEKLNYDCFPLSPSALKTTRPRWSLPPPPN